MIYLVENIERGGCCWFYDTRNHKLGSWSSESALKSNRHIFAVQDLILHFNVNHVFTATITELIAAMKMR